MFVPCGQFVILIYSKSDSLAIISISNIVMAYTSELITLTVLVWFRVYVLYQFHASIYFYCGSIELHRPIQQQYEFPINRLSIYFELLSSGTLRTYHDNSTRKLCLSLSDSFNFRSSQVFVMIFVKLFNFVYSLKFWIANMENVHTVA